jgi:hypothetical protein
MKSLIKFAASALIAGALLGFFVRPSGVHDPADQPTPGPTPAATAPVGEPQPEPTPGKHPLWPQGKGPQHPDPVVGGKLASVSRQGASCVNPGNPAGWCWFEGWAFAKKGFCIESTIPGAPLATVASMFRVNTIAVYVRFTAGGCAASGFPDSQRVVFEPYTAEDKAGGLGGACAYTAPANYGNLTHVHIRVNLTGYKTTPCGGDPEWTDLFGHELGHATGLSHDQPNVSSIMRDGHWTDSADQYRLRVIYYNRPAYS